MKAVRSALSGRAGLPALLATAFVALVGSAPCAPLPVAKADGAAGRMRWASTYEEGLAAAKKEKKLVLVDFYTVWCGWCKRLDADVFANDDFLKAAAGIIAVKVDAEKLPQLAQKFSVNSYPRLFFVGADGNRLEEVRGYLNLQDFTQKVKDVQRGDTEYRRNRDAAADPNDLGASQRFARFLSDSGRLEEAIPYWQQVHDLALKQLFANPGSGPAGMFHREALYELGRSYSSVGLDDVARQRFDECAATYPQTPHSAQCLLLLAQLDMKAKNNDAARAHLQKLLKEAADTPAGMQGAVMLKQLPPAPGQ